jgi:hypothetical protein
LSETTELLRHGYDLVRLWVGERASVLSVHGCIFFVARGSRSSVEVMASGDAKIGSVWCSLLEG